MNYCLCFSLSWIKPNQLNLAAPLVSASNTALLLSSFVFNTDLCTLAMKTLLLPSGRNGFMKIACTSGNMKRVPGLNSQTKKVEQQKLITLKLWQSLIGKYHCVLYVRDSEAVLIRRGQLTHVQQPYADGASHQRNVTPLEKRTSLPSYRKKSTDSPTRPLLVGLWEILFCHQPASNKCLANVTKNLSCRVFFWVGGWSCGQDKAKINKDENYHVSRKRDRLKILESPDLFFIAVWVLTPARLWIPAVCQLLICVIVPSGRWEKVKHRGKIIQELI